MPRRMDIVSVNCPFTEATKGLVSAERLALMPEHAYLVNTARGEIVDEQALAHALETGAIAGAGLDVYADEPSIPEGLRARDNVVLLPHIGSATIEGVMQWGIRSLSISRPFWMAIPRQTGFWQPML